MNKQQFITFLRKPASLDDSNLQELERLIGTYPYFQCARALLAKASKIKKTKDAGKKVSAAAIYATDRALLKKYITGDLILLNPIKVKESVPAREENTAKQAPQPTAATPAQAHKPAKEREQAPEKTPDKKDNLAAQAPSASNLDRLIEDLKHDMKELEKSRAKYLEVAKRIEEEDAVDKAVRKATQKVTGTKAEKASPPKAATKAAAKKPAATTTSKPPKTTSPAKKSGTSKTTAASKSTPDKGAEEKNKKDSGRTADKKSKTADQQEIIDDFIKVNPSFSPKGEKKNEADLSQKSASFQNDIGSEYLAQIYLEQGKKERAIDIYNSLMLRFPEKSTYFADIIKKLKEN